MATESRRRYGVEDYVEDYLALERQALTAQLTRLVLSSPAKRVEWDLCLGAQGERSASSLRAPFKISPGASMLSPRRHRS